MENQNRPKLLKRGGARNRRNRASWNLKEADCCKLIGASEAAFVANMPLNRFVTIGWGLSKIEACESVAATGEFIKRAREWLGRHGYSMPWVWVQENGTKYGQHCHILLHVDQAMDDLFGPMPLRWVKAILPNGYVAKTLQSQKLSAVRSARFCPLAYKAQLEGKLHYMMKTAPVTLEGRLGMRGKGHKEWGQSCIVYGKRAAVWPKWQGVLQSL